MQLLMMACMPVLGHTIASLSQLSLVCYLTPRLQVGAVAFSEYAKSNVNNQWGVKEIILDCKPLFSYQIDITICIMIHYQITIALTDL